MKRIVTIFAGVTMLAFLAGCDNARNPSTTTQTKIGSDSRKGSTETKVDSGKPGIDAETKKRKEDEKVKVKAKIDGIDANIKVMQDHAANATGDAKKKIDDEIKDLQSKRDSLQKQYDKIDTTEASAWDNFVTELHKAADSASDSAKKAADRVKK